MIPVKDVTESWFFVCDGVEHGTMHGSPPAVGDTFRVALSEYLELHRDQFLEESLKRFDTLQDVLFVVTHHHKSYRYTGSKVCHITTTVYTNRRNGA